MENILSITAEAAERFFETRHETEDGRSYTFNQELKDTYIIHVDLEVDGEEISINTTCHIDTEGSMLLPRLEDFDSSDGSYSFSIELLSDSFIEEIEDSIEKIFYDL